MKKPLFKFKISTLVIAAIFTLLTGVVIYQASLISTLTSRVNNEAASSLWNTKLIFACYNYKIYPCDDEGTTKWNEQNPDKAIDEAYLRDPNF